MILRNLPLLLWLSVLPLQAEENTEEAEALSNATECRPVSAIHEFPASRTAGSRQFGYKRFSDCSGYFGYLKGGKMRGLGYLQTADFIYIGEIVDDLPNGFGSMRQSPVRQNLGASGMRLAATSREGFWLAGKAHGIGLIVDDRSTVGSAKVGNNRNWYGRWENGQLVEGISGEEYYRGIGTRNLLGYEEVAVVADEPPPVPANDTNNHRTTVPPSNMDLSASLSSYVCVNDTDISKLEKLVVIGNDFQWGDEELAGQARVASANTDGDCDLKAVKWSSDSELTSYCFQTEESRMILTPHSVFDKSGGQAEAVVFNCIEFD